VSSTIPIVTASAADPFLGGLVKNLSRPGGNITGFCQSGKGHLKQGVWHPQGDGPAAFPDRGSCQPFDLGAVHPRPGPGREGTRFEYAFVDMPQPEAVGNRHASGCFGRGAGRRDTWEPVLSSTQRHLIINSAAEHRMPAIYERRDDAERGGLVSYAPNVEDQYRATAEYVVRILAGENPGDLPIQQPIRIRDGDQSQDCEGARDRDRADTARPRRRGDRVRRRAFIAGLGAAIALPRAVHAQQAGADAADRVC
jgi:putative ABC transport system substrate-binding protein